MDIFYGWTLSHLSRMCLVVVLAFGLDSSRDEYVSSMRDVSIRTASLSRDVFNFSLPLFKIVEHETS